MLLAGFGVWRSSTGWNLPERGKVFVLYGLFFGMAFVFYAVLMVSVLLMGPRRA